MNRNKNFSRSAVEVNEVQNCVGFTKSGQGYNFDLTYGDCDMRISQEENKIIFKSVFTDLSVF